MLSVTSNIFSTFITTRFDPLSIKETPASQNFWFRSFNFPSSRFLSKKPIWITHRCGKKRLIKRPGQHWTMCFRYSFGCFLQLCNLSVHEFRTTGWLHIHDMLAEPAETWEKSTDTRWSSEITGLVHLRESKAVHILIFSIGAGPYLEDVTWDERVLRWGYHLQ